MTNTATQNDDWPEHSAELGRKGMKALADYMQKHVDGRITTRELYIVTSVLWDTMSGLAPEADLRLIEAVNEEIRQSAKQARAQRDV
jgi:hypothetical protein